MTPGRSPRVTRFPEGERSKAIEGKESGQMDVSGCKETTPANFPATQPQGQADPATQSAQQGKIVGILWMVPIYAVDSFVSLRFKDAALYVDTLRDCYEGYALYLFLALMVGYLGDGDEYKVVDILESCPPAEHAWPLRMFLKGPPPHGRDFLRFAKFGVLQYSVIKPLVATLYLILASVGLYKEGGFSVSGSWLYISFAMNLSVCYAFYCLGMFYYVLKSPLKPFDPVPKFLCIKAVLFMSYWQSIIIAGLSRMDLIHAMGSWSAGNVEKGIQDLLICVEMLIISVAHTRAFPCKPYEDGAVQRDGASLLEAHFAHHTAIRDFNEVMPVLIPSGFRPGPATTTVRIPVGERASWRGSEGARSTLFLRRDVARGLERRAVRGGEIGIGIGNHKYSEEEQGEGTEADERLEDLDSLRQSLLGAEGTLLQQEYQWDQGRRPQEEDWEEVEVEVGSRWTAKDETGR